MIDGSDVSDKGSNMGVGAGVPAVATQELTAEINAIPDHGENDAGPEG